MYVHKTKINKAYKHFFGASFNTIDEECNAGFGRVKAIDFAY